MEWLTQNWTYLLLLVGVILFMRFGGMGCGFARRRARPAHGPDHPEGPDTPVGSGPATDPVSRRTVDPKTAVATIYQGRGYYFARTVIVSKPHRTSSPALRETIKWVQRIAITAGAADVPNCRGQAH